MESRYDGESRSNSYFGGYYNSYSSESRNDGESRNELSYVKSTKKSSVSLSASEVKSSLESIDALIEKLDIPIQSSSTRVKKVATERDKKIAELRKLREDLLQRAQEDEEIKVIESANDELDTLIKSLKNKLR